MRDKARSPLFLLCGRSNQDPLRIVARALARDRPGPQNWRLAERCAGPIVRIAPCRVHRPFSATAYGFAELITRHEQTFCVRHARGVKLDLLTVGCVRPELVARDPPLESRLPRLHDC